MEKHLNAKIGLVFISLVLVLSIFAFMLLNGSTAWFAKNEQTYGTGMSVSVQTTPNMIIGKTPEDILEGAVVSEVRFTGTAQDNMVAVTRDESVSDTFLKYITNHYAVDIDTGNVLDGMTLNFAPVTVLENTDVYYVDYTVYIASVVGQIDLTSLIATVTVPDASSLDNEYVKAVSVDFYLNEVSKSGYCGTAAVADGIGEGLGRTVDLFLSEGGTIPLNTSGNYIRVIMRCYFDGALQDPESGKAYINSYTVQASDVVFGVQFHAQEG